MNVQQQTVDLLGAPVTWAGVRGFNYLLRDGFTGLEQWQRFDQAVMRKDFENALRHFPGINAVRLWLSWDFHQADPAAFAERFELALQIAEENGLAVMPVLFNRWHAPVLDWGGVYLDHLIPHTSWVQTPSMWSDFITRAVGDHVDDPRIFLWDICNEPFATLSPQAQIPPIALDAELNWLRSCAQLVKSIDPGTPTGISIHVEHGADGLSQIEPLVDVLLIHPYYDNRDGIIDSYRAISEAAGKPLLATEACWGSHDDEVRVKRIHSNLALLKNEQIGWLAYVMNHTDAADGHREADGLLDTQGTLHFIEKDGSLRPGHDAFNLY